MIRLFVGIALPDRLRQQLGSLGAGVPGARWVAPENLHLTLRFIGGIEEGAARDVDAALQEISAPCFALALQGVGVFGKTRKARALWAGVSHNDPLLHLQAKIETAIQRTGLPAEPRRFSPHITLARLKGAPAGRVEQFIVDHAGLNAGPIDVREFHLFSSYLASSGAIYSSEASYALA